MLIGMDTNLLPGMDGVAGVLTETAAGADGRAVAGELAGSAPPRLRYPDRSQMTMAMTSLEDQLPADHVARTVWQVTERLDLSRFTAPLKARGDQPGRAATDPRLLVALWLYATIEGIGSAREIDRLCHVHNGFRWLCGHVSLNYHTLSDFRTEHAAALDDLLTQVLAVLMHRQVVSVRRIAQDGTKVRASAGRGSFHRRETLEHHLAEAQAQLAAVKALSDDAGGPARQRAARQRAAREQEARIEAALAELPKLQADQQASKKPAVRAKQPAASRTDPDARVMKLPNGGFGSAYNVQLAVDPQSRAVVGVEVTSARSDHHACEPLRAQVEARTGQKVEEHLLDGGYLVLERIERAEARGTRIYMPVESPDKPGAFAPKRGDGPGVAAWRTRMGTAGGQAIYSQRSRSVETVNADLKTHRGLRAMCVRGLAKVRCQALWSVLAYNILHFGSILTI